MQCSKRLRYAEIRLVIAANIPAANSTRITIAPRPLKSASVLKLPFRFNWYLRANRGIDNGVIKYPSRY